ncbi:MAG: fluoride efflux transporter CrcB [Candidatus Omnitrophica bacterium]|nr:fluoride efflux transporter CrcB [Candidatus Omnitrophota bacterium]
MKWFNLALGGITGTFARYILAGLVYEVFGTAFPYGTLIVNLTGCFLIGFLAVISEEKFLLGPHARILLMIGFCGAFTTFSTFMLETGNFIRAGDSLRAFLNVLASVAAGFLLFRLGILLGEAI